MRIIPRYLDNQKRRHERESAAHEECGAAESTAHGGSVTVASEVHGVCWSRGRVRGTRGVRKGTHKSTRSTA